MLVLSDTTVDRVYGYVVPTVAMKRWTWGRVLQHLNQDYKIADEEKMIGIDPLLATACCGLSADKQLLI